MESISRARIRVRGRVQGVFFRAETRQTALMLGLSGWVRNVRDGSVEAVFEGPRSSVERAIEWCKSGPRGARVDTVDVQWEESEGVEGFEVAF